LHKADGKCCDYGFKTGRENAKFQRCFTQNSAKELPRFGDCSLSLEATHLLEVKKMRVTTTSPRRNSGTQRACMAPQKLKAKRANGAVPNGNTERKHHD
jgi:hypothetical protein